MNINRLSLNIDKTNFVIFHPFNKPSKHNVTIKINNKAINEKESIKYLGVIVDSTLSWKQHIISITKKIARTIGIMYKLQPFLPLNVMKNVYYSLAYSHIIYAIEIWGSEFKSDLDKISILQKRVMRLLTFNDIYPTTPGPLRPMDPIFVKLNFLKVDDIYNYQVSKFVFKCINRTTPIQFHDWYKLSHVIHEHSTRSNFDVNEGLSINNLFTPSARTTNYGLKQLKVNGPRIWNKILSSLKNITLLNAFLKKLKDYYISRYSEMLHSSVFTPHPPHPTPSFYLCIKKTRKKLCFLLLFIIIVIIITIIFIIIITIIIIVIITISTFFSKIC